MKFTQAENDGFMKVTRKIAVEDGIVIAYPHGSTKTFRIETVIIGFRYDADQGWKVSTCPDMHGTELKRDGTDSKNHRGGAAYNWERDPEFQWLRDLADAVRPIGKPVLPGVPA